MENNKTIRPVEPIGPPQTRQMQPIESSTVHRSRNSGSTPLRRRRDYQEPEMKHFMLPRNPVLREATSNEAPIPPPSPASLKSKPLSASPSPSIPPRRHKLLKENAPPPPPSDLNSDLKQQPSPSPSPASKIRSPLPPKPPSSNPLKRKLIMDGVQDPSPSDSGVQVIVRMRPLSKDEEGESTVQKISHESLSINGHNFTFDSVADIEATQQDIFKLIGAPLVENCLAGFNSSVFAYGQTGSGKTYTIWGPSNVLSEVGSSSDQQGLTPRVFERLFARINEASHSCCSILLLSSVNNFQFVTSVFPMQEQIKHSDRQLKYLCRCSFLEIYNEQITDLLDPTQRNLQIREDVKSGLYVENLTEEHVFTLRDVTRLLIKGLSNRRTGATSVNAESSRSHSVFTCIVESRCKSMADGKSSLKTSRINLVDLAGSERQKLTGAAGDRLKEAGNINRSLSQLGNLINILAEVSQTGKQRHIPYRDSKLTFLLQESLGGNAKLAMVCAVSPAQSCKSETFSTLRFAQRAKAIKNKAVVNEEMEDDVNHLREVIRQLRDELHRVKANNTNQTGWDPHKSLNILKSLMHPHSLLPKMDEDSDEEMEIDEEAVEMLCAAVSEYQPICTSRCAIEDVDMEEGTSEQVEDGSISVGDCTDPTASTTPGKCSVHLHSHCLGFAELSKVGLLIGFIGVLDADTNDKAADHTPSEVTSDSQLGVSTGAVLLKSPTPSVSPKITRSRKSLKTSCTLTASQKASIDGRESDQEKSLAVAKPKESSSALATSRSVFTSTDQLAASIHRGMEIIDSHPRNSAFRQSAFRFSYKPAAETQPSPVVEKFDVGVQTMSHDSNQVEYICKICKGKTEPEEVSGIDDCCSNLQLVPVEDSGSAEKSKMLVPKVSRPACCSAEKSKMLVPKAVEKVLAGAIRREMALEEYCAKQNSEIRQLNRLVQQYKHERECNAIISQTKEDKILRLESLMDGVLPTEEFVEEEFASLMHEHKLLKDKCDNHPEVSRLNIELKRAQEELQNYRNFCDLGEREVLLEELQDLRSQLQFYVDSSSASALKRRSVLQLTYLNEQQPNLGTIPESTEDGAEEKPESSEDGAEEKLEQERARWTEAESKWISLAEELRAELDASRTLSDKQKIELDIEKKCTEELKEAMQMAMEGHARMLEQYADLEEKHILLLARHRDIRDGIENVKKAAARAGVKGAESKFINSLAAEISALRVEREKERRYYREEIKGLQAQLRDTATAVQAAGELLVRLREAEEAVAVAQERAMGAELEAANAAKKIKKLKTKHEEEIGSWKMLIAESRLPKEAIPPPDLPECSPSAAKYNEGAEWREAIPPPDLPECSPSAAKYDEGEEWREEFEPSSWFSGYDRCNI
ncbi:unnamed protein product [Linum tenue]|uniref:Kinesin motor domain-containing protein n=1 Tax=Linum tenue TaxID=586396 RepID=A0AAV0IMT9_9ROSI|nr:unnamed protein product [Linum tenue]